MLLLLQGCSGSLLKRALTRNPSLQASTFVQVGTRPNSAAKVFQKPVREKLEELSLSSDPILLDLLA